MDPKYKMNGYEVKRKVKESFVAMSVMADNARISLFNMAE